MQLTQMIKAFSSDIIVPARQNKLAVKKTANKEGRLSFLVVQK